MLAKRVIPTILCDGRKLVKGKQFNAWRSVGVAAQAVRIYEKRSVDEIVLLNISPNAEPDYSLVESLASDCFTPLTVGGGVRTIGAVKRLLRSGADKVLVNRMAHENPAFIREMSDRFGVQCVVVGIDTRAGLTCGKDALEWARTVEGLGAGEILLTSVDRDGSMSGYDLDLIRSVSAAVNIPVVASGGCGTYQHMLDAFNAGADAVAAASIYLFTDQTPLGAKKFLHEHGITVRLT